MYKVYRKSLIKIYLAFLRPVLEYGYIVWDECSDQSCKFLEDVQIDAEELLQAWDVTLEDQNCMKHDCVI